jgi:cytochrome c biogenesis protein CcmG/thiol:disulfide interchange protein DsbE
MKRYLWPLGIFLVLVAFLAVGLQRHPQEIPSPFIGKPAPIFNLPQLESAQKSFSPQDMHGQVWLLNVWASWCTSCRQEHPVLLAFSKQAGVPIVGLNYKDARQDGQQWLSRFGNPYQVSAFDADGRVGIDYGVYGVPETFVIDKQGVVRLKLTGPITPEVIRDQLNPLIEALNRA